MTQKGQNFYCFAIEYGNSDLVSFVLKVNWAALCVGKSGVVVYSHFYWLVLDTHLLSNGWVRCIKQCKLIKGSLVAEEE